MQSTFLILQSQFNLKLYFYHPKYTIFRQIMHAYIV